MSSAAAASLLLKLPPTGQDRRVVLVGTLAAVLVVAVAAMGRVACTRAVRSWAWPAAGAFVGYRCVVLLRSPLLGGGQHVLGVLVSAANLALDTVARHQSAAVSALLGDVVGLLVLYALVSAVGELMSLKYSVVKRRLLDAAYDAVKWLPPVQHEIQKEQRKLEEHFEDHLKKKSRAISLRCDVLPAKGVDRRSVLALMREVTSQEDQVWQAGKVSGAIYHGGADHIDFLNSAFGCYSVANPLHPDIWPSGMKFEVRQVRFPALLRVATLTTRPTHTYVYVCVFAGGNHQHDRGPRQRHVQPARRVHRGPSQPVCVRMHHLRGHREHRPRDQSAPGLLLPPPRHPAAGAGRVHDRPRGRGQGVRDAGHHPHQGTVHVPTPTHRGTCRYPLVDHPCRPASSCRCPWTRTRAACLSPPCGVPSVPTR